MTLAKQRKLKAKKLRKSGLPFVLAHILARFAIHHDYWKFHYFAKKNTNFRDPFLVQSPCDCCGPMGISFVYKGRGYMIDYHSWEKI